MEQWRSFFSKAGEDVWTIIEQAILLAAHDHPREFKEKRCDIAEMLFATGYHQGDKDVIGLSASVITNCINRTEVSEGRHNEHMSTVHTEVQAMHDAEQHGAEFCPNEAQNGCVHADRSLSTTVCCIKEALDNSMQPDGAVLCALRKLESLHIGVDVLKETEIGKQVNNLRKHPCKEIRLLARGLVRCWKELVDDWVSRAGTPGHLHGEDPTSERDKVEEKRRSTCCDTDAHIQTQDEAEMQRHWKCIVTERDSCLEAPEERGSSSRAEFAGLGWMGRLEKPHFNFSCTADRDVLEDVINIDSEDLGKKGRNIRASVSNRSFDAGKGQSDKSNADKRYWDYGSQISAGPTITAEKITYNKYVSSEKKLVTDGKRKPNNSQIQTDNAKRHQAVHPSDSRDCSPGELILPKSVSQKSQRNQVRK